MLLLFSAAVLFAVFPYVAQQRLEMAAQASAAAAAERVAASYRAQLEARVAALQSSTAVLSAIGLSPAREGTDLKAHLATLFPGAKRVRLLPVGHRAIDADPDAPLGYADLEQLRAAERGEAVPLEVLQPGTPKAHVNQIVRLELPGGGAHLLVASLAPDRVRDLLGPVHGYVSLVQRAAGREVVVASRGDAAVAGDAIVLQAAIAGTRWELRYRAPRPQPAVALSGWPGQLYAVLLALFGLAVLGIFAWLARMLRHDQAATVSLLADLFAGRAPVDHAPRLRSFANMQHLITAMGRPAAAPARMDTAASPFDELLGGTDLFGEAVAPAEPPVVADSIFRACDIRGVVGQTLTIEAVRAIGQAIGSEAHDRGQRVVAVGRDGRLSGPELAGALIQGLQAAGTEVVDIGMVPTPVLYYATRMQGIGSGVMITGSHNPPDYNGLKVVLDGEALHGEAITRLRERIERGELRRGTGTVRSESLVTSYVQRIAGDIQLDRPLKVVIDCGNGVAGAVAPDLFRALGCEVTELFCEVDGSFPNHHPDPGQPENMVDLCRAVQEHKADLGLAFDGDGDRLGIVDNYGKLIWPDRVMMLFVRDLLSRQPGAEVLYDVKCSRNLRRVIEQAGGTATMWRTGHSLLKAKMRECGAPLACEMSGHFFFAERWYGFDDALYAGARLLEILSRQAGMTSSELFAILPDSVTTPELMVPVTEGAQHEIVARLVQAASFPDGEICTIDGLRVDFDDGFGLVRASNTTPNLVLRFEGTDEEALAVIEQRFRALLQTQLPDAQLPF